MDCAAWHRSFTRTNSLAPCPPTVQGLYKWRARGTRLREGVEQALGACSTPHLPYFVVREMRESAFPAQQNKLLAWLRRTSTRHPLVFVCSVENALHAFSTLHTINVCAAKPRTQHEPNQTLPAKISAHAANNSDETRAYRPSYE